MDDENLSLGKCCICEQENKSVRNLITLHRKSLDEKGGWGCFTCGLPARGAVAALCDNCLDKTMGDKAVEIKFACLGYPGENRRIEIEKLTEDFDHDMTKHPEENRMNFISQHQSVFCQNCQDEVWLVDGQCTTCFETVCPHCGCTDSEPCVDGCSWMPSGLCSACEDQLEAEFVE